MDWGEYIRDESLSNDQRAERLEEFVDEMTDEVRDALLKSDLDEDDYWIDPATKDVALRADGWEMSEQEEAERLRDELLTWGIGDIDGVGAFVYPRNIEGEIVKPSGEMMEEYCVSVMLHKDEAHGSRALGKAKEGLNNYLSSGDETE